MTRSAAAAVAILTLSTGALAAADPANLIVPSIEYPALDVEWLLQDDIRREAEGLPLRFAVPNEEMATPGNHGMWDRDLDGQLRWRIRLTSPGAPHINLGFESWNMPHGASMMVESIDGTHSVGPFSATDNQVHGEFWLPVVVGDDILVTITCDDDDRLAIEQNIVLTKVNIGYRGFGAEKSNGSGRSGSCNVDVACAEGDPWQAEIACAALYSINGYFTCSGAMLNNTAQDQRPFFLTADHCGVSTGNDQSMVVYWNYENSYCRTPGSGDSGGNGDGSTNQFTAGGAILRADGSNSDFTLVELNNDPNPNFGVGFCGWDRRTATPQGGICIHHPNLEEKRISFDYDALTSNGSLWRVNNWELGTTEPGSSGSPLFNPDHRIVGQLYGGNAACNNNGYDVYGKLSTSWNAGLAGWLDYAGTGEQYIDTYGSAGGNGGVCCLNGDCFNVPEGNCDSANGTWFTDQNCGTVDCDNIQPTGACCLTSGACVGDTTSDACGNAGGSYQGDDSDCANVTCEQPDPTGACCLAGGNCATQTSEDCAAAGGSYQGNNTSCSNIDCDAADVVEVVHAIVGSGKVSGDTPNWTVDVYAAVDPGFRVDAVAGNSTQQKMITSTYGFYQDPYGGPTSTSINPAFFEFAPNMEWDSRVTIGAIDDSGNPYDENVLQSVGINWDLFESGGDLSVGDGTWFILPDDGQGETRTFTGQDCTQRQGVLLARLTAMELDSTVMFEALVQGRDSGGNTWQDVVSYTFNYEATEDCNDNLVPDSCDIANGTSDDSNGNGIPDECDNSCPGDADGDGDSDVDDILACIAGFGTGGPGDVTGDGAVDVNDLLQILAYFGNC